MECSICLNLLNNDIVQLKCEHKYHKVCIDEWYKIKTTCPMCRDEKLTSIRIMVLNPTTMDFREKHFNTVDLLGEDKTSTFDKLNIYNHSIIIKEHCENYYKTNYVNHNISYNKYLTILLTYEKEIVNVNASFDTKFMPSSMISRIFGKNMDEIPDIIAELIKESFMS